MSCGGIGFTARANFKGNIVQRIPKSGPVWSFQIKNFEMGDYESILQGDSMVQGQGITDLNHRPSLEMRKLRVCDFNSRTQ